MLKFGSEVSYEEGTLAPASCCLNNPQTPLGYVKGNEENISKTLIKTPNDLLSFT